MDVLSSFSTSGCRGKASSLIRIVVDSSGTATVDDIPKLKFTEKVLRESMRRYPPVWNMCRSVGDDYALGGYTIPAGSTIMMSQYLMHRDPRY
jgi:cytochrome P450